MTESKPSVKLTRREPDAEQREQGHQWLDWCGVHDETPEAESGWRTMHDAAPTEATKALRDVLKALKGLSADDDIMNYYFVEAKDALDRLRQTPEGRALLQENDDG